MRASESHEVSNGRSSKLILLSDVLDEVIEALIRTLVVLSVRKAGVGLGNGTSLRDSRGGGDFFVDYFFLLAIDGPQNEY